MSNDLFVKLKKNFIWKFSLRNENNLYLVQCFCLVESVIFTYVIVTTAVTLYSSSWGI